VTAVTPTEDIPALVQAARSRFGSSAKLAQALNLGKDGGRSVRAWLARRNEPNGPTLLLLLLIIERPEIAEWLAARASSEARA
jgi:DNA-binding transcriptional regulator YiaG